MRMSLTSILSNHNTQLFPLLKRAACLDNDIFRLREKAVLEGKNYNLLLQAPLDVTDLSLPSVFHGLQRRAFVEWKVTS